MSRTAFLSLIVAAGCALATAAQATPEGYFECGGLGDGTFEISIDPASVDRAEARYVMGIDHGGGVSEPIALQASPVASGFAYEGEGLVLRGQGRAAQLRTQGVDLTCDYVFAAADGPLQAQSLGGNLRNGPGVAFDRTGSLHAGQTIILRRATSVRMDGYTWFEVQDMQGTTGYHWGGIICASGDPIEGIIADCP